MMSQSTPWKPLLMASDWPPSASLRWESVWEHRGNAGIGLSFPEGRDRIQFAANLDVKVSGGDRGQEFS